MELRMQKCFWVTLTRTDKSREKQVPCPLSFLQPAVSDVCPYWNSLPEAADKAGLWLVGTLP